MVSIDSDLASTSGLEAGIAAVDQRRALNVGVAEANMMLHGEAFAALGYNAWVSTFCPFFNWQVMRRIAVGHQERLEAMQPRDGWLSEGHGLDLTFLATAANFETRTNGATHMGNDDITIFDAVAHLKIIDVSCPQQMLSIMKWIMEGNRGLVYVRVMRAGSAVLYGARLRVRIRQGYTCSRQSDDDKAVIVSSGRGVHEALAAADESARSRVSRSGWSTCLPSTKICCSDLPVRQADVFAEQNNGYLWQNYVRVFYRRCGKARAIAINALTLRAGLNSSTPVRTRSCSKRSVFLPDGWPKSLCKGWSA